MESPENFAKEYAAKRAEVYKQATSEEDIFMNGIGRVTCEMLLADAPITLDSLLEKCFQKREVLGQKDKPEQSLEWHRLNAMIAHLQSLKK